MNNYTIADNFSLLSKLIEIHGGNSFKAKSYSIAAFTIEKLPEQLFELPKEKIFAIKGIGEATGKKIIEQLTTGSLATLEEYVAQTPPGILQMLHIKGLGPKKIATIWKELEVESIGELLYACNENRLLLYKGFGSKTQQNVKESIEFYLNAQGRHLYADVESFAYAMNEMMQANFKNNLFEITGDFKMQNAIIDKLEWVTTVDKETLKEFFIIKKYKIIEVTENESQFKGEENVTLNFYYTSPDKFYYQQFITGSSKEFLEEWLQLFSLDNAANYLSEENIFEAAKINFIPAYLRSNTAIINEAKKNKHLKVIEPADIKGIIHSHSKWSDGDNTLEEMATAAKLQGFEYLVISDHSKSAFYANGLTEERIKAQHEEINELNKKLAPFKIFKSIECDILYDGALDYDDNILSSFDLVITSVHSILKMTEEKAMQRLLRAIENTYTSILGHLTGRLLLSRNGYPVDHKKIIEACAANNVAIELNAHPRRLDIDWCWINYALQQNVLISIDPDAHSVNAFRHIKYGVLSAQKGGLTADKNVSSFSLQQFEKFLAQQHAKRNN